MILCRLGFHKYSKWKFGKHYWDISFGDGFAATAVYKKCLICGNIKTHILVGHIPECEFENNSEK